MEPPCVAETAPRDAIDGHRPIAAAKLNREKYNELWAD